MIKTVIVDDEPLARMVVKEYLQQHTTVQLVQECSNGFEGVKAIQEHQPDLVFLDIQMPKINGFEMLELVDKLPAIIFTTAYDAYAMKAFDAHAVDYLLKPFSQERFDMALQKMMNIAERQQQNESTTALLQAVHEKELSTGRVVVKTGGKISIIPVENIHYIEAADDYTKLHTAGGIFLKHKTMAFFEKNLSPAQFVRTHRSCIVQVGEITRLEPYEKESFLAVLRSGARVPVSQSGYSRLRVVLGL